MALPTVNDVQPVDPILTNMMIGYMQADMRFVATRVFPEVSVDKDSGTYMILTKKYWALNEMAKRAPGQKFPRGGFGVSSSTYKTIQDALEYVLPDEVRANSQLPMDLLSIGTQWLAQQSLIAKEVDFSTDFMASSVWETDKTVSNKWSDFSASDPVGDIEEGKNTISGSTGQDANTLVHGQIVHKALVNHPDLLDRIKYTQAATNQNMVNALAALFGLDNYWVAKASYNTANEGQTESRSQIIDDDALLCHVKPGAATMFSATCGKTFTWAPGGGLASVRSYYDETVDSNILKSKQQLDQKAVATDLGYFFADVVD